MAGEPAGAALRHIALLIDAENMGTPDPRRCLDAIFSELLQRGDVVVKRAYGDFAEKDLLGWDAVLRAERVKRVTPSGERGKKACDMLLIIEAMDLLHQNPILDCFVLATGDGDFAPLADRLREAGKQVLGFGFQARTSKIFIKACNGFVAVENMAGFKLKAADNKAPMAEPPADAGKQAIRAVKALAAKMPNSDGWVQVSAVVEYLRRQNPAFDVRSWGYDNARDFFRHVLKLELHSQRNTRAPGDLVFVRKRPKGTQDGVVPDAGRPSPKFGAFRKRSRGGGRQKPVRRRKKYEATKWEATKQGATKLDDLMLLP